MTRARPPRAPRGRISGPVIIASASGSLRGLTQELHRLGWTTLRVPSVRISPVRLPRRSTDLARIRRCSHWLVTSRAVANVVLPVNPGWRKALAAIPHVIAVGPDTARTLGRLTRRAVVVSSSGSAGLLGRLRELKGARIAYLRSDRAGTALARALRLRGARVIERVAYRIRRAPPLSKRQMQAVLASRAWLVSSPSAVDGLRALLGPRRFLAHGRRVPLLAIGPRTASACRALGISTARASPTSSEEGFTRFVRARLGRGPGRTRP